MVKRKSLSEDRKWQASQRAEHITEKTFVNSLQELSNSEKFESSIDFELGFN